ncbi:MAG: metal ABC transporter permease [Paracoccaceae bacterium]|nr:metal ABC transporter permease [Paracoccaceae bacterium]
MIDPFLMRVGLAAVLVAMTAGPLGCFVLWRRMVFFGDTISHAALLGVALSLATDLPVTAGVLLVALAVSVVVLQAGGRFHHTDTVLGVASHSALALGLVSVSLLGGVGVDLMTYLMGDILSVGTADLFQIAIGGAVALGLLVWRWKGLLVASVDREMAVAHGFAPRREALIFTVMLAVLVAVAIKVVGALMISALLVMPAATARQFSATPERMAVLAAFCGVLSAMLGLFVSFALDTPTGPSIVVAALVLLLVAVGGRWAAAQN